MTSLVPEGYMISFFFSGGSPNSFCLQMEVSTTATVYNFQKEFSATSGTHSQEGISAAILPRLMFVTGDLLQMSRTHSALIPSPKFFKKVDLQTNIPIPPPKKRKHEIRALFTSALFAYQKGTSFLCPSNLKVFSMRCLKKESSKRESKGKKSYNHIWGLYMKNSRM